VAVASPPGFWLKLWKPLEPNSAGLSNNDASLWSAEAVDAPRDLMPVGPSSREEVVRLMRVVLASRMRRGLAMPPTRGCDERPEVRGKRELYFLRKDELRLSAG
jgi:hypothetical protein